MKKIILLLLGAIGILNSCQDPEYVRPTADRQGLTSLTAYFTSGPFVDKGEFKLEITDEETDRYVIPIPWYYPETSDETTEQYMTSFRIRAELEKNCILEPALTILDLTKENWFTFTNAKGAQRKICITGERVKSSACDLVSFSIVEPELSGIIDKANMTVSLISGDDLGACLAKWQASPHATVTTVDGVDITTTPIDYNNPVKLMVTADNGTDKKVYTVEKATPDKIDYGFNASSVEQLFTIDPVGNMGLPPYNEVVGPTMAYVGGKLVVCLGNGSTPKYFNALNGVYEGNIELGGASAGSVTSDDHENMLIVNKVNGGETINIYRTNSVKKAPTLFHSFTNPSTFPAGAKIKVNGNIDGDALIVIPTEGIDGVSSTNEAVVVQVKGGAVLGAAAVALPTSWGSAPVNTAGVVAATTNPADGMFVSKYDPSFLQWIKADGSIAFNMGADSSGWGLNPNCLDAKTFNNAQYLALFVVSHFPAWGMNPELYLLDVTNRASLEECDVWDSPAVVLLNKNMKYFQDADYSVASGDVLIAPSADGFKLNVFYYDHNSQVVGAYSADCIKK